MAEETEPETVDAPDVDVSGKVDTKNNNETINVEEVEPKKKNKILATLSFFFIVVSFSLAYKSKGAKAGEKITVLVQQLKIQGLRYFQLNILLKKNEGVKLLQKILQ